MRQLWGRLSSVNVQKAVWALDELALPFQRIEAGGAHGGVDDPEYRAMNPNGLVPVLKEDGFVLWESNAILRYLAHRYGGALALPDDVRERAAIDQWLDWQATTFTPAMRDAFWQLVRVPAAEQDADAIEASRTRTEACAEILERHLATRSFIANGRFGIADIAVGCAVHRWLNLPVARLDRPDTRRWYRTIAQRSAASTVLSLPIS